MICLQKAAAVNSVASVASQYSEGFVIHRQSDVQLTDKVMRA